MLFNNARNPIFDRIFTNEINQRSIKRIVGNDIVVINFTDSDKYLSGGVNKYKAVFDVVDMGTSEIEKFKNKWSTQLRTISNKSGILIYFSRNSQIISSFFLEFISSNETKGFKDFIDIIESIKKVLNKNIGIKNDEIIYHQIRSELSFQNFKNKSYKFISDLDSFLESVGKYIPWLVPVFNALLK